MFVPRPKQAEVLEFRGGLMGVSAVPGSGKTVTLSRLAANLLLEGRLEEDQEVLVVTLVNSAVDNFYRRVSQFVRDAGLLPHWGYRVRTLHGLAHDIVRERPEIVGLSEGFLIIDEREAESIREDAVRTWLRGHPYALDDYLAPDLDEGRIDWINREQLPRLVGEIALAFIRYAKDNQLTPQRLQEVLAELPLPLSLVQMGVEIYDDYQRALVYRGGVDFDDLIRLALDAMHWDVDLLARLRQRWPYILEDEAQDSSLLQEQILETLVGELGNWVRVGDPNQAIYETFTTADPRFLRQFIARPQVLERQLPNSGRSTQSIMNLANHLVDWTQTAHPTEGVRDALKAPPYIEPTPPDDPQPNPSDNPGHVHLFTRKLTPHEEMMVVADSLERWLPDHGQDTVAALVPRNVRGFDLVDELRHRKIEVVDSLLRSTSATRSSAGVLGNLLRYLSDPGSGSKLATAYKVWRRADRDDEGAKERMEEVAELLRKCGQVEDYLWPRPGKDWLHDIALEDRDLLAFEQLLEFRTLVRRWQGTVLLPVDQILLTLAQDLFTEPAELALTHKLAVVLRRAQDAHPQWRLPELTGELGVIARNERRFLGFSDDDSGFDPERYKGKVVVSTVHKAKGLEWDRVYLMSVNNYDFPSGRSYDQYIPEKWFIRQNLNLVAETLAQLDAALSSDEYQWYQEGVASQEARLDYVRERLRLLYVGITRARKELIITWNTGRKGELRPAVPFLELQNFWTDQIDPGMEP